MRVVLSTWGKFHVFHLARQLHRRGWLERIFSTYPRFKLRRENLPTEKIVTNPWLHVPFLAKNRFGLEFPLLDQRWGYLTTLQQQRFVARRLPPCDVFAALSGSGYAGGRAVQRRGGRYICDRGSSHIRWAEACLREEFARWNADWPGIYAPLIDNEEREYESADRVVVPSRFVERTFIAHGVPAEKIRRIPYGVALDRFEKTGAPPADAFVVLFVGQISLRKGVPYLLEAFAAFRHPRKVLRIVGAARPEMRDILRRLPRDRVEFLGPVPHAKLKRVMSAAHVMVLPSLEEGLALVQAEAMACGCPVIASAHTGAEDLFTDGEEGFIVPVRDPAAIRERLERLADDPGLRERMSETARRRVKSLGGWDRYGEMWADLCRELAG